LKANLSRRTEVNPERIQPRKSAKKKGKEKGNLALANKPLKPKTPPVRA
jgi:hypothetical protein